MVSYVTVRVHVGTNSVTVVFLQWSVHHRYLHSFPTRRSSDLPDGSPLDNNALGFAASTGALVTTSTLAYGVEDRKSTRLNSSHLGISDAAFCCEKTTGLTAAAGTNIYLYNGTGTESGLILGRV